MATNKQQRFVEEYLIDLNASQAAIRAGYSATSARKIGCELLTKPDIQDAIQAAMKARSERTQINQDWVLKRLAAMADGDIKRVCKWDAAGVHLIDSEELSWEDTYTITEVSIKETIKELEGGKELVLNREKKVKQNTNKLDAAIQIGKHLGMFKEQVQLTGQIEHTGDIEFKDQAAAKDYIRSKSCGRH